jgi:hypothetical protein
MQLAPDLADPYDISNFPAAQYPYAFETFGNDGSTTRGSNATDASNRSLNDLASTVPNAATVYTDLQEAGASGGNIGNTFVGSDHYPIVGDYSIVTVPPAVASPVVISNVIQFTVTGAMKVNYAVDVSTNLSSPNWIPISTNQSPFTFKDTNNLPGRFYRGRLVP